MLRGVGRAALLGLLAVALIGVVPTAAGATKPHRVTHVTLTFVDSSRPTVDTAGGTRTADSRTIVTEIYIPSGKGPFPLVVMAHGNAGNPGKLTQLLTAWSQAGYVVAAPTFPLTNDLSGAPTVIGDYVNQPADVSFTIDQVLRESRQSKSPLFKRVNARHIGLAGHSLGGATAYGAAFNDCCRDRRIDAVVAMDAVKLPFGGVESEFEKLPLLLIHITGDPVIPFSMSEGIYAVAQPPKYLMALSQGIHFEPFENAPSPHDGAVIAATTAFWNGYLKGIKPARRRVISAGTEAGLSAVTAQLR
jgi:dienelactone hydrolase